MFGWLLDSTGLVLFKSATIMYLSFIFFIFVSWYFKKRWYLSLWENNSNVFFFTLLNGVGLAFGWITEGARYLTPQKDLAPVAPLLYFFIFLFSLIVIGLKFLINARENIRGDFE